MSAPAQPSFEAQVLSAFRELKSSLTEIFESAKIDVSRAFPAARQLKVNKNLTWKASKIIRADSPSEAIDHLPGKTGVKLLLDALAEAGASAEAVGRTSEAIAEFDRVIEQHASDRETLELMLDGLSGDSSEPLEKSRRLAFLGNSGIWGVQAQARLVSYFMTPNASAAGAFDLTTVMGFTEVRRLRTDVPWTLMRLRSFADDGASRDYRGGKPLFPHAEGLPVVPGFTSDAPLSFSTRQTGTSLAIDLTSGPTGNQGAIDVWVAQTDTNYASMYASGRDTHGRFLLEFATPVREVQLDLLVHKDLPAFQDHDVEFFARSPLFRENVPEPENRTSVPIRPQVTPLGSNPALLGTSSYARYVELLGASASQLGHALDDFSIYRMRIDYPPVGTTAVFRFPLLVAEGAQ